MSQQNKDDDDDGSRDPESRGDRSRKRQLPDRATTVVLLTQLVILVREIVDALL
jgi:hypothetical protein